MYFEIALLPRTLGFGFLSGVMLEGGRKEVIWGKLKENEAYFPPPNICIWRHNANSSTFKNNFQLFCWNISRLSKGRKYVFFPCKNPKYCMKKAELGGISAYCIQEPLDKTRSTRLFSKYQKHSMSIEQKYPTLYNIGYGPNGAGAIA